MTGASKNKPPDDEEEINKFGKTNEPVACLRKSMHPERRSIVWNRKLKALKPIGLDSLIQTTSFLKATFRSCDSSIWQYPDSARHTPQNFSSCSEDQ